MEPSLEQFWWLLRKNGIGVSAWRGRPHWGIGHTWYDGPHYYLMLGWVCFAVEG